MFVHSRTKRFGLAFVSLLALAGCAEEITTEPVGFQRKAAAKDVKVIGVSQVSFRTSIPSTKGNGRTEVKGVPCRLESKEFKAEIVTPAKVDFPMVKGKPSPMLVRCTTKEYAADLTFPPGKPGTVVYGTSAAGLVALLVSSAVIAASDNWTHANQPINLPLEPRKK